jgi:molybdopterin/thiamine biosynthesis adenylyltransferase
MGGEQEMDSDRNETISYEDAFAAQLPALGAAGQERLRRAWVHLVGTGRVGSALACDLRSAGIGGISADDDQAVEPDNGNSFVFRVPEDVGKPKVLVLARSLGEREHFRFQPIPLPVQSAEVDGCFEAASLVVSCANTLDGRLIAEEKAIRYHKPILQVAAFDGREHLGGLIALHLPGNPSLACFGCYFENSAERSRGEGLLSTVTTTLAAMAANMAVELLSGIRAEIFREKNLFYIDLENYDVKPLAVQKRKGCRVCGTSAEDGK